jgi:single-strand DNA-binding protein
MSLNRATVIGNLGGDPELRHLPTGQPVVGFSIATDESFTDKEGQRQKRVEWHNIVAFGKLADTCGKYLKKGRQVVCCESFIGDGGGPPGIGLQEQIPNHPKLRG